MFTCGCSGESCNVLGQKTTIGFEPEYGTRSNTITEPQKCPWLDPDLIPPTLPIDEDGRDAEYTKYLLIDPECIEQDPELMEDVLVVCKVCRSELISGRAKQKPSRRSAIANKNYLGPVPPELKDLSVVEETMIARCRSKCSLRVSLIIAEFIMCLTQPPTLFNSSELSYLPSSIQSIRRIRLMYQALTVHGIYD
jgi:hypothetical protein